MAIIFILVTFFGGLAFFAFRDLNRGAYRSVTRFGRRYDSELWKVGDKIEFYGKSNYSTDEGTLVSYGREGNGSIVIKHSTYSSYGGAEEIVPYYQVVKNKSVGDRKKDLTIVSIKRRNEHFIEAKAEFDRMYDAETEDNNRRERTHS